MNLWVVGENPPDSYEFGHWVAYWSWGSDEAVAYWKETYPEQCFLYEADYTVHREANTKGIPEPATPQSVRDALHLRLLGWSVPGDDCCEACGLWEMDGMVPVCDDCGFCQECGCEC